MSGERIRSFREFWPFYVHEHAHPVSRRLHFIGTGGVIGIFLYAVIAGPYWLLILLPICGYAFAWTGHFFFEKNKPATFKYPVFSLISDFYMFFKMLTGGMGRELEKHLPQSQREV